MHESSADIGHGIHYNIFAQTVLFLSSFFTLVFLSHSPACLAECVRRVTANIMLKFKHLSILVVKVIARRSCKLYSAIDSCLLCVFFRCPCTRCSMTGFENSILKLFSKRIHSIKLSDFVATAISGLVTFTYCRYNNTLSMDQCS